MTDEIGNPSLGLETGTTLMGSQPSLYDNCISNDNTLKQHVQIRFLSKTQHTIININDSINMGSTCMLIFSDQQFDNTE